MKINTFGAMSERDIFLCLRDWNSNKDNALLRLLSGRNKVFNCLSPYTKSRFLEGVLRIANKNFFFYRSLTDLLLVYFDSIIYYGFRNKMCKYMMGSMVQLLADSAEDDIIQDELQLRIRHILNLRPNDKQLGDERVHYYLCFLNTRLRLYSSVLSKNLQQNLIDLESATSRFERAQENDIKSATKRLREAFGNCRIALDKMKFGYNPDNQINLVRELKIKQPYYQANCSSLNIFVETSHHLDITISNGHWIKIDDTIFSLLDYYGNVDGKVDILLNQEGTQLKVILSMSDSQSNRIDIESFKHKNQLAKDILHLSNAITFSFPILDTSSRRIPYPRLLNIVGKKRKKKRKEKDYVFTKRSLDRKQIAQEEIDFHDQTIVDKLSDQTLCHIEKYTSRQRDMLYMSLEIPHQLSHFADSIINDPLELKARQIQIANSISRMRQIRRAVVYTSVNDERISVVKTIESALQRIIVAGNTQSFEIRPSFTYDHNSIPHIFGDAQGFLFIIENLLHNASKSLLQKSRLAGIANELKLNIKIDRVDSILQIRVIDNGIGLEPGTRIQDIIVKRSKNGHNIGLSLSKMIAENIYNGSLEIEKCSLEDPSGFAILLEIQIKTRDNDYE